MCLSSATHRNHSHGVNQRLYRVALIGRLPPWLCCGWSCAQTG